ncbi:basic helix-loop-helix domain-containing protein USF3 [Leucoraja erinacea]|uniref:basic helix-loop-helix domain-containing protein USF3 n=1 Tax=Leucoraja erinaceus TaxID=7782 RepID=UPI0024567AE8|nr:basic helix-loop-helix domain-containing protein USF3 [Leucoraja erinacea]
MPEMTENQTPLRITHRKKNRESHNAVERHRKKKINSGINKIGELIPCSPALKQSKNMILDQAYKYISELKRQNDEILLNGGTKEQGEEIVRLRNQLDNLRNENDRFLELLKANDICLHDDPTIHWKRKFKGSKVAMMISPNQMQDDMLIYTNGNQLNGNCHQTTVQSSPELPLNTLKNTTPESCLDIMMPMAEIGPVENGVQLQTGISEQDVPDCLPTARTSLNTAPCTSTTTIVQSMLNVSTNTSDPDLLQHSHSSCALTPLASPTSTPAPIVLDCPQARFGQSISASGCPVPNVPGVSSNASLALPLHLQQMGTMCMDVECPSGITQQTVLGSTSASGQNTELRSMKWPMVECPQNVVMPNACQNSPTLARGFPPSFKAGAMCNGSMMSPCPVASSWTVSCPVSTSACSSESNGLGAFTCMTFAGNTRTTWTTLQLAGNTVHPVSQVSCSILPTTLSENVNARSSFHASEAGPLVNNVAAVSSASSSTLQGTSFCSTYSPLNPQVPVTLQTPLQPVPAVPTAKVVSLLPPLQVIQMAHTSGGSDPSSPNSQKLIILQPANPSSPAVVRGAINSQAQGQQIVIIQAASQTGVSVVPPHANRAAPSLDSSAGSSSSGAGVHSVGGKHLVHILPRPVSSCGSSSSHSPAVTGAGHHQQQQQKTISVNGQIFAVQPVKQGGSSMHIIQPTTSADPHTNVALNTFGALTSLSQSVSQMSGPLGRGQALSPSASSAQTVCTAAATTSSPFTNNLPAAALASRNPVPPKCAHGAHRPSKCKKSQRKLLSAKHGLSKRARGSRHQPRAAATTGDHARSNPGSPPEFAAVEQALPADCLPASQHLSLPHNAVTVTTAAASHEQTAATLSLLAPSLAEASALCPEHPEETRAPPASLAASSPRVDLLKDDVCAVTESTAPTAYCPAGETGTGKESGLGRFQAVSPTPHGIPGITSVSQQLESLAAAQRHGRVEASEEMGSQEGKACGREPAPSTGKQRADNGLPSGETEGATQPHPCPPEHEGTTAPLSAQRQTESPMSTSSGSSRGFSVASLLPDSAREDGAFNSYGLPDHSDIVSLAARAIFEQESPGKGSSPDLVGYEAGAKPPCAEKAPCPSLQPDKGPGMETNAVQSQGPAGVACVAKETPSVSLACPPLPNPVAMNQGHGGPTAHTQLPSVYPEQGAPLAEYPAKVHPQSPLALESRLKQSVEMRKDASKRNGPTDHLVSTAKRQKQCQGGGPRLDCKPGLGALAGHLCDRDPPFMAQMPASSPNHNLGALFPSTNFLGTSPEETLRTMEAHCNGPQRVQDPAAQQMQPHGLLQANGSSPSGLPLAHTHSYYKHHHQSQARDRHLYQLQHHYSHGEGSAQGQAHGVQHQLRVAPQDAQMQKKRGLVRAAPGSQLSIQPKQQHQAGGGQGRHKGSQQQHQHVPHTYFSNAHPDKRCENSAGGRSHHLQSLHAPDLLHPDGGRSGQGPGIFPEQVGGQSRIQRLLTSRSLEQQMASKARPSDKQCPPHRQERNRISSYSAEALIGRPSSAESRMAMQSPRAALEQSELRTYLDLSMNKSLPVHGLPPKLSMEHCMAADVQSLGDCQPFKATQAVGNFEVQASRGSEMGGGMSAHRGIQAHGFRLAQGTGAERPSRLPYLPMQGISTAGGASLRDGDGSCHQSFLQSLLPPPLAEQLGGGPGPEHGRNSQCALPISIEYSCAPARDTGHGRRDGEGQSCDLGLGGLGSRSLPYPDPSSVSEIQSRNSSPSVAAQKASLRLGDSQGNKCHANAQVSSNMHGGVRVALAHGAERSHPLQPGSSVAQRVRHQAQGGSAGKLRPRSGSHRGGSEALERSLQLPLPSGGGMILGRQQPNTTRTASIVRFVADSQQVPSENLTPEQLSQSFGFPFIAEGGMNPPLNANPPFIPPVTQPGANRTPTLIPVEQQNPLPSFYPPYSPAHPNLSNDLSLPYFSNQIFTSPNTEKASNPFGSILSPPRPVGFPQPSFPLLPDISARPIANSSSITAHLSNFNLTTLFPEIAAAPLAADTPAMPMSPLLPLTNPALSDVSKQHSNRSAHNISHILGHDGSSAV